MTEIVASTEIAGVKIAQLRAFGDERGRFMETFRKAWFPERSWDIIQTNRSDSKAGVLRGLHYHFRQVDYWYCPFGIARVGLADLRRSSPTYGASQVLEIGDNNPLGRLYPLRRRPRLLCRHRRDTDLPGGQLLRRRRRVWRRLERSDSGRTMGRDGPDPLRSRPENPLLEAIPEQHRPS